MRTESPEWRVLIFIAPLLALAFGLWRIVPASLRLRSVESELIEKKGAHARIRNEIETIASYPHQSLQRAIPTEGEREPIFFLAELSHLARENRVELVGIQEPKPTARTSESKSTPPPVPATGNTIAADAAPQASSEAIEERINTLTVEGLFSNIIRFVSTLERGERILAINNLKMRVSDVGYPILSATFDLTRYVSKENA